MKRMPNSPFLSSWVATSILVLVLQDTNVNVYMSSLCLLATCSKLLLPDHTRF